MSEGLCEKGFLAFGKIIWNNSCQLKKMRV